MLTEIYIEALLIDEDLADQVWESVIYLLGLCFIYNTLRSIVRV
jgi:hypothetical protein